jgi:hypothetical protein
MTGGKWSGMCGTDVKCILNFSKKEKKPEGKRLLVGPTQRWENILKWMLKK